MCLKQILLAQAAVCFWSISGLRVKLFLVVSDESGDTRTYNIVHLIYRAKEYEGDTKDFEFSRLTMEEHWRAGHNDAKRTLRHQEIFDPAASQDGVFTFDIASDGE